MKIVAVIQARMGSSRLPGKMMLELGRGTVLSSVVRRVNRAETIDQIIVATSTHERDDVIESESLQLGVETYRGSETDVLGRMYNAASQENADIVVRVCGDCPLVSPRVIDAVVQRVIEGDVDYASNNLNRTFPLGLDVEAFTMPSFSLVESAAETPVEREHVTIYYKENPDLFSLDGVTVKDVFDDRTMYNNEDLRLTLDTFEDFELLSRLYDDLCEADCSFIDLTDAVEHIEATNLDELNAHIEQKSPTTDE